MRITINLDDSTAREIKELAGEKGVSVSRLVADTLKYYLVSQKRTRAVHKILSLVDEDAVSEDAHLLLESGRNADRF